MGTLPVSDMSCPADIELWSAGKSLTSATDTQQARACREQMKRAAPCVIFAPVESRGRMRRLPQGGHIRRSIGLVYQRATKQSHTAKSLYQ